MNTHETLSTSLSLLPTNTLYISKDLYEKYYKPILSEPNFYKIISRLIDANVLTMFSKGVFYLPKIGKNGFVPLSPSTIKSLMISSNEYGCEMGEVLYHQLKLTPHKPKSYTYYTSELLEHKKTYGIATFNRLDVYFDGTTTAHIQFMHVLCHYDEIPNLNKGNFTMIAESFSKQFNHNTLMLLHQRICYQKKEIAFLVEVLDYFKIKHQISLLLSKRSTYHVPSWK